jgi:uncharacterized OB-fold protein
MDTIYEAKPADVIATGTGRDIAMRGVVFDGERVHLVASECEACATRAWPPASRCHACWKNVRTIRLSDTGKLYAFTRVHVGPDAAKLPYAIGYVDLPEGVRVYTHLHEEHAALQIDATVQLHGQKSEAGTTFWFEVKA